MVTEKHRHAGFAEIHDLMATRNPEVISIKALHKGQLAAGKVNVQLHLRGLILIAQAQEE